MAGVKITAFDIHRLEVPTGRVIGDNNCHYASFDVVALCLKTAGEHIGWGYEATCWKGTFKIPAWYIKPMASLAELRAEFERSWWPRLKGNDPAALAPVRRTHQSAFKYLDTAVQLALWDLTAQQAELPLYQFLGGSAERNRIRAYGSPLDFPLSEPEAVALAKGFVQRGFNALKIKIGAENVECDIQRLHAIRAAVGPAVELTADANQIWDADTAIERLERIAESGLQLGYIEDPLPYADTEGFARLNAAIEIDVVGHDYAPTPQHVRALLECRGIERVRTCQDVDFSLAVAALAKEYGKPMIFGNSLFEVNIHLACALPNVERLEFSNLAWNDLLSEPVRFENGYAIAPSRPGHGLEPNLEVLREWSRPNA